MLRVQNGRFPPYVKRIKVISLGNDYQTEHARAIGEEARVDRSMAIFNKEVCTSCSTTLPAFYIDEYIDLDDPDGNY